MNLVLLSGGSGHGNEGGGEKGSLFLHEQDVFWFQYIPKR